MADRTDSPTITPEAVTAAARASFMRQSDFDSLSDVAQDIELATARRMLKAAAPHLADQPATTDAGVYLHALATAVAPLGYTEGDVTDAPYVRAVNAAREIHRLRDEVASLRTLHDQRDAIERQRLADRDTETAALRAENERLRANLDKPCGECHPCVNWSDETWRRADRKPPHVHEYDALIAELDRLRQRDAQYTASLGGGE